MYSCANYPRGCRGRCNVPGGRCEDCKIQKLRRPGFQSPFASPFGHNARYERPWEKYSPDSTSMSSIRCDN
ncbi:hypothetical protein AAP_06306 [Ascosphaera apis ARSEF 7405]|uniref:Uncharacterized protein n=1 Tax=Ascosphaera apis ARSEF 7405 TaxID=392613 RepID=A0A167UW96_9EURO|nr:hypothetical protein AAP_06306 [Ascosphaera apis ARSEF 7405]